MHTQTAVSENRCTPKSSILIGFSIINHPFWGTTIFGNTQTVLDIDHQDTERIAPPRWWNDWFSPRGKTAAPTNPEFGKPENVAVWQQAPWKPTTLNIYKGGMTPMPIFLKIQTIHFSMGLGIRAATFAGLHPPKFNSSPLKSSLFNRKEIFQPPFFRCYVKLRWCKWNLSFRSKKPISRG